MGQRFQIFIKLDISGIQLTADEKKQFKTGRNTAVVALHNQWLYGRGPLFAAQRVLKFFKYVLADKSSEWHGGWLTFSEKIEHIKYLLSILHFGYGGGIEAKGIQRYTVLNYEDELMKDCFDRGDNNDGVLIIDLTSLKYCFASFGYNGIECDPIMRPTIKNYVPLTAETYVKAYYPKPKDKRSVNAAINGLKGFKVLTLAELRKIFPKMEELKPRELAK
jgi:hypothetical protein